MLLSASTALVLVEQPLQPVKRKPASGAAVSVSAEPESTVQLVPVQTVACGNADGVTLPLAGLPKVTMKRGTKLAVQVTSALMSLRVIGFAVPAQPLPLQSRKRKPVAAVAVSVRSEPKATVHGLPLAH